jgi:hypothetical protein
LGLEWLIALSLLTLICWCHKETLWC